MPNPAYGPPLPQTQVYGKIIREAFSSFGYQPSEEEISSLLDVASEGVTGAYGGGTARANQMVANYVNTVRQMQNADANNPLRQVLSDERGFFNDTQTRAADFLSKATGAPQLFGGMTPEQIDQYLAPVKRQLDQANAGAESTFARRGLPGSSLESGSIAEQARLYGENVLQTGLNVGLQKQQMYGNIGTSLYGLLPGISGQIQGTAGTLSDQARADAATRSQLPLFLSSYASGQRAMNENEAAAAAASQAAIEAGHKSGFSWNLGFGPSSIGQNAQGATNVGANIPYPYPFSFPGSTTASSAMPPLLTGSNPTSGASNPTSGIYA